MEVLHLTLKELENRQKNNQDFQEIYVKKLFPSFQQEFKNYDIHDIANYVNYNLQNIHDDLKHIQTLLEESPDEPRFIAKKNFLVQLTQKIIKKIQGEEAKNSPRPSKLAETNNKESDEIHLPIIRKTKQGPAAAKPVQKVERKSVTNTKEPEIVEVKEDKPKQETVVPVQEEVKPVQEVKEVVKKVPEVKKVEVVKEEPKVEEKVKEEKGEIKVEDEEKKEENVHQPAQVQVEEEEEVSADLRETMIERPKEIEDEIKQKDPKNVIIKKVQRPSSQDRKKRPQIVKRKKSVQGREKLGQIAEETVHEESEEEGGDTIVAEKKPKKKLEFTQDQEKQIQEMSAQYGVQVEALRSYLETKAAHNQFNWMGIKRLDKKVDLNLEISKLESEYERFVQRQSYYNSNKFILPLDSPDALPYLPRSMTPSFQYQKGFHHHKKFYSTYNKGDYHQDPKSMTFGGTATWGVIEENFDNNSANSLPGSPRSLRKLATSQSLTLTRGNSNQDRNQGMFLESKNVQDEHWSDVNFAKSRGQVKLPSITSFGGVGSKKNVPSQTTVNAMSVELGDDSSTFRRPGNLRTDPGILSYSGQALISPHRVNYKMKGNSYSHLPGFAEHIGLNRMDTRVSIEDSLSAELAQKHREFKEIASAQGSFDRKFTTEMKKGLSQMNTTRSNYLMSMNSLAKPEYADSVLVDGFSTLRSTTGRQDVELTGRDRPKFESQRTQFSRKDTNDDNKSFAIGATIQTISTKSMSTVYTQEAPSRYMSLKSMGSGMRVVEGDLEYCGTVKRLNLLGSGSQAKVFLCQVKEFEDPVALKQYDANKAQYGGQSYEALKDEFHMLRQLNHENVIKYHCLYRSRRKTFSSFVEFGVIMEYMSGGPLERYIETNFDSITLETKKSFMKQILQGLDCLHANKIIHRDLKPGNILLSEDKTLVKISDFGISTQTNNDSNMTRSIVGTPWYMAPEIINEEAYSYKADIWSAGCCFLHLITGNKPFHLANARQAMQLMTNYNNPLESIDEESLKTLEQHKGLKDILDMCFSKDKDQRPTAARLLESSFFTEE